MEITNPAGTQGFEFLEFTTKDPSKLIQQFSELGLKPTAKHHQADVTIYQLNNIRFIINSTTKSLTSEFADRHGSSVSAMGFRVKDAQAAFKHAIEHGAEPYTPMNPADIYHIPAIYGVGRSLIYFIDYDGKRPNYIEQFKALPATNSTPSFNPTHLTYIDHVTHNLYRGNMKEWADFYMRIFNFREVRHFDIEGKMTGLKSQAMASPCGQIRIPLNESTDDQSQIEEFLQQFNGEGIQHIALGTDNIYESVANLKQNKINFLDTPDTYYELIESRLPKHGEDVSQLKALNILIDGETTKQKKLLLQIFTENMLGPVFFEIIQRKGDDGFGEGNFQALFESLELDQIRRGVIKEKVDI